MSRIIVDTGPLIETLVPGARYHKWITEAWKRMHPPFFTCEAVVSEAAFLLKREECDVDPIFLMLERGFLKIDFSIQTEITRVRALMARYRNRPMSVADACLVRMAEMQTDSVVFTMDRDFHIYRQHGTRVIQTLMPE